MTLYLMRHPKPAIAEGVCYGATDLDLAQAPDRASLPPLSAFAYLITSPLKRCRRLADSIAEISGIAPQIDARLQEMHFGRWEGIAWADIPRDELDLWTADFHHARPHDGESVAALTARVAAALADHRAKTGPCLIITHAGVIKAATRQWNLQIAFGEIVEINSVGPAQHSDS